MTDTIQVVIVDDHQSVIDGYYYRLSCAPDIQVVAEAMFGEGIVDTLRAHPADVLLLDLTLPASPQNRNPYPVTFLIPQLLAMQPTLAIVVVSMQTSRAIVRSVMEAGARGYIYKDDCETIKDLPSAIRTAAQGSYYFSRGAYEMLRPRRTEEDDEQLSLRQQQALALCAAYPELSISKLAEKAGLAYATLRTILYGAYVCLAVDNRAAAVKKARELGLILPLDPDLRLESLFHARGSNGHGE